MTASSNSAARTCTLLLLRLRRPLQLGWLLLDWRFLLQLGLDWLLLLQPRLLLLQQIRLAMGLLLLQLRLLVGATLLQHCTGTAPERVSKFHGLRACGVFAARHTTWRTTLATWLEDHSCYVNLAVGRGCTGNVSSRTQLLVQQPLAQHRILQHVAQQPPLAASQAAGRPGLTRLQFCS